MSVTLSPAALDLLASSRLAHLVTINADGSPQISGVWVKADAGGEIVFASLGARQKLANITRDPRVALSIETDHVNDHGLLEYLVVHGHATITEGGAADLLHDLAHTYLGPDVRFPPMDDPPAGYIAHIAIDRVGGIGDWTTD